MKNAVDKITISGSLKVSLVAYRDKSRGQFKVAKLNTPIGVFEVKDKWIDNLETGEHEGVFYIKEIKIRSYPTRTGGMFSVLVADVPDYHIQDSEEFDSLEKPSVEVDHRDPADEEHLIATATKIPQSDSNRQVDQRSTSTEVPRESEADEAILKATQGSYKTMSDLPDEYSPDQSLPRAVLRAFYERINYKKGGQFRFDGERKTWIRVDKK